MKVYDDGRRGELDEPERRPVGIAEYAVTVDGATLTTSGLGSCIGLALFDPEAGVAGLAHVMLPSADAVDDGAAAKFADTGTELLVEEMLARGATLGNIEAKLAGGSAMLDFSAGGADIGQRNAEAVRETLDAYDVPVVAADVGGEHGRSLRLDGSTGDLVVTSAHAGSDRL